MESDRMRNAMAAWASGVTIVAARTDERVVATTVSAFLSLSLDPPRILIAIGPNATVRPFLQPGAVLGVSILAAEQKRLAMVYADSFPVGPDPFNGEGTPLVDGCLVGLSCTVERVEEGGSHAIIIADVNDVEGGPGRVPLIRYDRRYYALGE